MAELPKHASSKSQAGGHSDCRVWPFLDCRTDVACDVSSLLAYGACRLAQLIEGGLLSIVRGAAALKGPVI
jgi:hypothetical protein